MGASHRRGGGFGRAREEFLVEGHVHAFPDNVELLFLLFLYRFGFTLRQARPQLPFGSVLLRYHTHWKALEMQVFGRSR